MTVTLPAPVAAVPEIVTLAVSEVALTNAVEFTVIPDPENAAVAPVTKPVPVIVTFWLTAPWPREPGLVEVTVGAALTVNAALLVTLLPSPFATVTLREPVVAVLATVMFAVSEVELTNVVEFTVIPVPENETASDAPPSNPVPVIVTFWLLAPRPRELGLVDATVGAALTVNTPVPVPCRRPGW